MNLDARVRDLCARSEALSVRCAELRAASTVLCQRSRALRAALDDVCARSLYLLEQGRRARHAKAVESARLCGQPAEEALAVA
jgi:hypothetical protein